MTCCYPLTYMAALLIPALHTTPITANLETDHGEEKSQRGIALLNHNYSFFYAGNYPSCLMACISDPQCKSFNFWWPNLMCHLNNKTKHSAEAKFLSQDISSTYMGLMREPGNKQNKKLNLMINLSAAGLAVTGTIAGSVTLNPIIFGVITGSGVPFSKNKKRDEKLSKEN